MQYKHVIEIFLKYFQRSFQICKLKGNRFRNGELSEVWNRASVPKWPFFAHFSTLFPKFRRQILQCQPLIGILFKYFQIGPTFPNMQTKPKSVQKWRTCSDSKSGFKQWFHHFSHIFQHHFPNSATKYCNANLSLVYS